jgi:HEAT repeat protein
MVAPVEPVRRTARTAAAALSLVALALPATVGCGTEGGANEGKGTDPKAAARANDPHRKQLEGWWRLYLADDPGWPKAREQWLSGSEADQKVLLDNLFVELLRTGKAGSPEAIRSERAQRELSWLGSAASAFLADALRELGRTRPLYTPAQDRVAAALAQLRAIHELAAIASDAKEGMPVRLAALRALGDVPDDAAVDALIDRLAADPAFEVRAAAADLLKRKALDDRVRVALAKALDDREATVRAHAANAIVPSLRLMKEETRDPQSLARVVRMLGEDGDPVARGGAAEALALPAADPAVSAALVRALRDPDPGVVEKAAHSLVNQPDSRVQLAMVDALERGIAQHQDHLVYSLLVDLRASVGREPAPKELTNPDGWRRLIRAKSGGSDG